jgi:hypothetical protein
VIIACLSAEARIGSTRDRMDTGPDTEPEPQPERELPFRHHITQPVAPAQASARSRMPRITSDLASV